jgi:putative holliday junction resolvase
MAIAALDYGKARIGVALADDLGLMAHARPAIDATNRKAALASIAAFAKEEAITRFLVGLPLSMDGSAGAPASRARTFAQAVADATGCDVELIDERLSTVQARRQLRASGVSSRHERRQIDSVAACMLLQAWLDARIGDDR